MDQDVKDAMQKNDSNIESIALHMSQYGAGDISIINTYWNEGIAIIQISNVEKWNAISGKMMNDFRNCIKVLESWKEGKAVILQGRGNNFSSGGDLDYARKCNTQQDGFYLSILMNDVLRRLETLPLISIALIHGPTLGGGAEIAIACNFILASRDVKFGFVHGKMGIITAWGGATRLARAVGQNKALKLLLTSNILKAEECLKVGLIEEILNNETRLEECLEWTRSHVEHHYSVTRAFKQALFPALQGSVDELLDNEQNLFVPLWGGQANKKALEKSIKHVKQ